MNFSFLKILFLKKKNFNRETVSFSTLKILEGDMKTCYKNISKILDVTFILKILNN